MFSSKPLTQIVKEQSLKVKSVFSDTITKLLTVNEKAQQRIDDNNVDISRLTSENNSLEITINENNSFISKIEGLFAND